MTQKTDGYDLEALEVLHDLDPPVSRFRGNHAPFLSESTDTRVHKRCQQIMQQLPHVATLTVETVDGEKLTYEREKPNAYKQYVDTYLNNIFETDPKIQSVTFVCSATGKKHKATRENRLYLESSAKTI